MNNHKSPRFIPTSFIATPEQVAIQVAEGQTILIEANAGAAKTTTLALRAAEALVHGMAPEKILILVFTPEARDVMKKRLLEIGIIRALALQVRVETFEDFASSVLQRFDGYAPAVLTTAQIKPHVLAAINDVSERYAGQFDNLEIATHNLAISQFLDVQLSIKASMLAQRDYEGFDVEEAAYTVGVTLTHWLTFLAYEQRRYGKFDEAEFRATFDAIYDLARRLGESAELRASLPCYSLLMCDELHDLNEATFRILLALLSLGKTQFVGAGDKDQVIYATLGADAKYMRSHFMAYDPALIRLPLTATYRYGADLASAVANFKQKKSLSALLFATPIQVRYYQAGQCPQQLLIRLAQLKGEGECAILIRDRHESIHIENALIAADIGYQTVRMRKYFQRDEILFLRGMIAIALKNLHTVASLDMRKAIVEALIIYAEIEFPADEDYPDPIEAAKASIAEAPHTLQNLFDVHILASKSKARISDVVQYLKNLPQDIPADDALRGICQRIGIDALVKRIHVYPYEASVVSRSIAGFIDCAANSRANIQQFSEWLGSAENSMHSHKHASVVLECVAHAKGIEFDHVLMPYLELGQFPDPAAAYQQEENLFYVGITRAKYSLTLLTPSARSQQSSFIRQLKLNELQPQSDIVVHAAPPVTQRTDLKVPFAEKNEAKALGAKWDATRKVWYVDAGVDLTAFARWMVRA